MGRYDGEDYPHSYYRERELAEALDEVERLRGVIERLELEKFDLAEELVRAGGRVGRRPAGVTTQSALARQAEPEGER